MLSGPGSLSGSALDVRWAIFDPRVNPPVIHKFAWRINTADAPTPPCNPAAPPGYQGLFCSGHCWLPDGRLLVVGGDYWSFAQAACGIQAGFAGSRLVAVFDPKDVDLTQPYQTTNGPGVPPGPGLPSGKPWTSLVNLPSSSVALYVPRWYPTATLMAPANLSPANPFVYISIAGGLEKYDATTATIVPPGDPAFSTHEVLLWDLNFGTISKDLRLLPGQTSGVAGVFDGPTTPGAGGLSFFYYPRTHFVSARAGSLDGRLWMAGMVAQSASADIINAPNTWTNGSTLSLGAGNTLLEEATAVMFPPVTPAYRDWQIVMGGMKTLNNQTPPHTGPITNECYIMPTRAIPPNWVGPVLPMIHARKFHNVVILPDASIVVVGGGTNPGHGVIGGGQLEPEMFYNGAWYLLSDQATERTYHSIALALQDGRLLSAGGNSCHDLAEYEIFEPPYLQGTPLRPTFIQPPPTIIRYGQPFTFQAGLPFGQQLDRVVLLRPGSVTHGQDPGQRYEPLSVVPSPDDVVTTTVLAPSNPTLVPPGYCMMFLLSAGVPSVAHWVQLLP